MEKALLDTDILSEYLKGHDRNVARHAADYAREHGVFTFTSVTVHEIVFGLQVKNAAAQLQKALAWLSQNEQITPTASDYLDAAKIKAAAHKNGSIVELADSLIAAATVGSAGRMSRATQKTSRRSAGPAFLLRFRIGAFNNPTRFGQPGDMFVARPSILGRLLDVINDKNLNWRFGRFKFQSKLFLEGGENRETHCISYGARPRGALRHVRSPPQM